IFEDDENGRSILNSLYPIVTDQGDVVRCALYSSDITAHKRMQAIDDLFPSVNLLALSNASLEETLHYICTRTADIFHLPLVWVGNKNADGSVKVVAAAGPAHDYARQLENKGIRWDEDPLGEGLVGQAIRSG